MGEQISDITTTDDVVPQHKVPKHGGKTLRDLVIEMSHDGFSVEAIMHQTKAGKRDVQQFLHTFLVGQRVKKKHGYPWPGIVVAVFKTRGGHTRIVVECRVPEVEGALHIFSPENLEHMP
jgi:hypothetical protein